MVDSPVHVKKLTLDQLQQLAEEIRHELITVLAKNGGHLGPNLGVVEPSTSSDQTDMSFVVADIPGLIEGAHEGAGLGTQFLRHIERTRLLVHLVDVSDASGRPDPAKDFEVIMGELHIYAAGLESKPMIVAASKCDVANESKLTKLKPLPINEQTE